MELLQSCTKQSNWSNKTDYTDVIMGTMASQITSLTIVSSTVYSGTDQIKYYSSASLAFVREIHRWPVNSPHKGPVTRKMFPFDDVIMKIRQRTNRVHNSGGILRISKHFCYNWYYVLHNVWATQTPMSEIKQKSNACKIAAIFVRSQSVKYITAHT